MAGVPLGSYGLATSTKSPRGYVAFDGAAPPRHKRGLFTGINAPRCGISRGDSKRRHGGVCRIWASSRNNIADSSMANVSIAPAAFSRATASTYNSWATMKNGTGVLSGARPDIRMRRGDIGFSDVTQTGSKQRVERAAASPWCKHKDIRKVGFCS